jgi:ABC-type amino acid transport substrate-binding protein
MKKKSIKHFFITICFGLLAACGSSHKNGSYTVAYDPAWMGLDLMGQQNTITGFSRDLLKEIGKVEKIKFSFVSMSWDTLIPNLKAKQYDAIFSSLYPYIFNQTYFDFSSPYLLTGPAFVLPLDSKATSIADFSGKEIGVIADSPAILYLEKNPEILIRTYDLIPDMLNDIVAQNIEGAACDILIASAYCNNIYHDSLKVVGPPMNDSGLRLVALEQSSLTNLIQAFDDGLAKIKKNGTYRKLLEKWTLNNE